MKNINVNRQALVSIIRANRLKHIVDSKAAVLGWQRAMRSALLDALDKVDQDLPLNLVSLLSVVYPVSQEADYDRALFMLNLSVDDVIPLDDNESRQLVNDEWVWKAKFVDLVGRYVPSH